MTSSRNMEKLDLEKTWNITKEYFIKLINALEEGNLEFVNSAAEYSAIYSIGYSFVSRPDSTEYYKLPQIYKRYKQLLKMYISSKVLPALREKKGETMVREFVRRWEIHRRLRLRISGAFSCFQDSLMRRFSMKRPMLETADKYFRKYVFEEMRSSVRDAVISVIREDRQGTQIDRTLLKDVLGIFLEIGKDNMDVHENDIEVLMLKDTVDYYAQRAASWSLEECSCMDYMLKAGECMKREEEIIAHYLHSSGEKLFEIVPNELLSHYKTQLLENLFPCCSALLKDENKLDLSKLYFLFCRIPEGLETLVNSFREHVIREGTAPVMRALNAITDKARRREIGGVEEEAAFVYTVLELHDKYVGYVINAFNHNAFFYRALNEALEGFCNKRVAGSTSEEFLATLCDNVLKKGGTREKLRDDEIESILVKVTRFLDFVSDRDLFGEFYKRKLASRLLYDKSTNDIHELSMLSYLKQQFGDQLAPKMERMIRDLLQTEVKYQVSFELYLTNNPNINPGINLDVRVLNFAFWPSFKSSEPNLPFEMIKCVDAFEEFYSARTKKRKLTWLYSMGTCNVVCKFDAGPIEVLVTPYYAILLLLFNNSQKMSYLEIKSQLNLGDEDLVRLLHSIVFGNYKILLKEPDTKQISTSDGFQVNYSFTNRRRKIKILLPSEDEKKKVDMNSNHRVSALIVRIMKSKKSLHYQQLLNECIEQHGGMFKIDGEVFKKIVENLITQDYIERDQQDINILRYIP